MPHTMLRLPTVKARTGLSRSTIYLRVSRGTFPAPVPLGAVPWAGSRPRCTGRAAVLTRRCLVRHALRHRPDHIVVGEVRGGETADLLQALNTGHSGSLTTVHANNAESALSRLASCAMQGGGDLPWDVTCRGVVDGIAMVIHMTRADGRR